MTKTPPLSISHAGFHVFDMDKMVKFFTQVYGFHVVDRGAIEGRGEACFLSTDPRDHHQLVIYSGRTKDDDKVHYNHISFRADSLDRLRKIHKKLQIYPGVTRISTTNHGNAWSVYSFDPEGNRTEAFIDSPWQVAQPFGVELDLNLSDEEIRQTTEDMLKDHPTAQPMEEWRAKQAAVYGFE